MPPRTLAPKLAPRLTSMLAQNRALALIVAGLSAGALAGPAQATTDEPITVEALLPHVALYDATAVRLAPGSAIVSVSGTVGFGWRPVCEGYETQQKVSLLYAPLNGPARPARSDFTGVEALDGLGYTFSVRESAPPDGSLQPKYEGDALRRPATGETAAFYTQPGGVEFRLPADTVFPTEFTLGLLQARAAGQLLYKATLFDGNDGKGPLRATAVITELREMPLVPEDNPLLEAAEGVRVRAAFYPLLDTEEAPDYEMVYTLLDNGIIAGADLIYTDMTIRLTLTNVEAVEPGDCSMPTLPRADDG